MVKHLFLVRHGQAESAISNDFGRELTSEGELSVLRLGRWMSENKHLVDKIFSSPAIRAKTTSELITEGLELTYSIRYIEDLYEASIRILLREINKFEDDLNSCMLVGHNPSLTYLVEYLTGESFHGMEPGGLAHITFSNVSWSEVSQNLGKLSFYRSPHSE